MLGRCLEMPGVLPNSVPRAFQKPFRRSFREIKTPLRCCLSGIFFGCGGGQPPRPTLDRNPGLVRCNPLTYRTDSCNGGLLCAGTVPIVPGGHTLTRRRGLPIQDQGSDKAVSLLAQRVNFFARRRGYPERESVHGATTPSQSFLPVRLSARVASTIAVNPRPSSGSL